MTLEKSLLNFLPEILLLLTGQLDFSLEKYQALDTQLFFSRQSFVLGSLFFELLSLELLDLLLDVKLSGLPLTLFVD